MHETRKWGLPVARTMRPMMTVIAPSRRIYAWILRAYGDKVIFWEDTEAMVNSWTRPTRKDIFSLSIYYFVEFQLTNT
jgi:hypothetical protein